MGFAEQIAMVDRAVQSHLGGVAVTYTPVSGPPVEVQGLFDENYIVADASYNGVETVTPAVVVRLEDLPTDPRDEDPVITILGVSYTVRTREIDGVIGGSIRLALRRSGM